MQVLHMRFSEAAGIVRQASRVDKSAVLHQLDKMSKWVGPVLKEVVPAPAAEALPYPEPAEATAAAAASAPTAAPESAAAGLGLSPPQLLAAAAALQAATPPPATAGALSLGAVALTSNEALSAEAAMDWQGAALPASPSAAAMDTVAAATAALNASVATGALYGPVLSSASQGLSLQHPEAAADAWKLAAAAGPGLAAPLAAASGGDLLARVCSDGGVARRITGGQSDFQQPGSSAGTVLGWGEMLANGCLGRWEAAARQYSVQPL